MDSLVDLSSQIVIPLECFGFGQSYSIIYLLFRKLRSKSESPSPHQKFERKEPADKDEGSDDEDDDKADGSGSSSADSSSSSSPTPDTTAQKNKPEGMALYASELPCFCYLYFLIGKTRLLVYREQACR